VEAVEYFLLPLPASFKVLPFPQKFNRFQLCFHIPAACFMKNASASGSSKSQMLPSSLRLLSSKCFRFHKNFTASTSLPLPFILLLMNHRFMFIGLLFMIPAFRHNLIPLDSERADLCLRKIQVLQ